MRLLVDMNLSPRWVNTLLKAGIEAGAKPSVVQIRSGDVRPETVGPALIEAVRQMSAQLKEGALLTVDPARARLRILPLHPK